MADPDASAEGAAAKRTREGDATDPMAVKQEEPPPKAAPIWRRRVVNPNIPADDTRGTKPPPPQGYRTVARPSSRRKTAVPSRARRRQYQLSRLFAENELDIIAVQETKVSQSGEAAWIDDCKANPRKGPSRHWFWKQCRPGYFQLSGYDRHNSSSGDHSYAAVSPRLHRVLAMSRHKLQKAMKLFEQAKKKVNRKTARIRKLNTLLRELRTRLPKPAVGILENAFTNTMRDLVLKMVRHYKNACTEDSAKTYSFLRRHVKLPHASTLRKWAMVVDARPGFTQQSFDRVAQEAQKGRLFVSLVVDKMAKIPLGYALIDGLDDYTRANLVREYIIELNDAGVRCINLTCDGTNGDITMLTALGMRFAQPMKREFAHPSNPTSRVHAVLDAWHMLKPMRYLLAEKECIRDGAGKVVAWRNQVTILEIIEQASRYLQALKDVADKALSQGIRNTPVLGFLLVPDSIKGLAEDLVWSPSPPLRYLLTRKLSQGHLELFFATDVLGLCKMAEKVSRRHFDEAAKGGRNWLQRLETEAMVIIFMTPLFKSVLAAPADLRAKGAIASGVIAGRTSSRRYPSSQEFGARALDRRTSTGLPDHTAVHSEGRPASLSPAQSPWSARNGRRAEECERVGDMGAGDRWRGKRRPPKSNEHPGDGIR
ncbi:hypothetical protein HPB47_008968 [Ixodes persulcatus]|uniref:Uncharacterized protein n=1 Tax=Ixodes persulcatus TaxID=34615 RepID=A0AC60P372_IXOPE|nr:hypothetical protein HPB47_008968 [Ixodes persulcatus]